MELKMGRCVEAEPSIVSTSPSSIQSRSASRIFAVASVGTTGAAVASAALAACGAAVSGAALAAGRSAAATAGVLTSTSAARSAARAGCRCIGAGFVVGARAGSGRCEEEEGCVSDCKKGFAHCGARF